MRKFADLETAALAAKQTRSCSAGYAAEMREVLSSVRSRMAGYALADPRRAALKIKEQTILAEMARLGLAQS